MTYSLSRADADRRIQDKKVFNGNDEVPAGKVIA
jgi:hypothetical protein